MSTGGFESSPFIRDLASSQRKTREHALDMIIKFIRSRRDLSLLEMLKIWKGLFFCFYHSDGPLVQQNLARSLSYTLVPNIPEESLHLFLRAFWITMGRDWHALDRYRLDKYMYLVRCYVGVAFEVLLSRGLKRRAGSTTIEEDTKETPKPSNKKNKKAAQQKGFEGKKRKHDVVADQDEESASDKKKKKRNRTGEATEAAETEDEDIESGCWADLQKYLAMLEEGVLSPVNFEPPPVDSEDLTPEVKATLMPKGPDGLRYHLMDIWVDELEKVVVEEINGKQMDEGEPGQIRLKEGIPMQLLLRPITNLKENSITKTVRKRAADALADPRLKSWGVTKDEEEDQESGSEEGEEFSGFD
ncbi:sphinganine kinase lcb4 [Ascosphaera pollenicola]|nr:sphinganine kinase lcb4 [Ascosphaera pollenicola]